MELKRFLRARRAAIAPEEVGIARGGRRLTPGLRREEVALAADVGLTWYTWLEQGRDIQPSAATLHRLARALRLSMADETYLFSLAGIQQAPPPPGPAEIPPAVLGVMDTYQGPAAILDCMFDVLAANAMARQLYDLADSVGPFRLNQIWQSFMNPKRKRLYPDYDEEVAHFVRLFRLTSATALDNARFSSLIAALLASSAHFAKLWHEQRTDPLSPRTVRMSHAAFGSIEVHSLRLPLASVQGGMLLLCAPANEDTVRSFTRVALLSSRTTQLEPTAAAETSPRPAESIEGPRCACSTSLHLTGLAVSAGPRYT